MYGKLLKSMVFLWAFVFIMFCIKMMISYSDRLSQLSEEAGEKISNYITKWLEDDVLKLILIEQYGMTIEGISLCEDKNKSITSHIKENPLLGNLSSSCWNGDCKVSMIFKDKVPKKIALNVKLLHSKNCLMETYNVASAVEVVGYHTSLKITDELKQRLGLSNADEEISFKHQTGYSKTKSNGTYTITFYFDELLSSDILMVDTQEVLEVNFELK